MHRNRRGKHARRMSVWDGRQGSCIARRRKCVRIQCTARCCEASARATKAERGDSLHGAFALGKGARVSQSARRVPERRASTLECGARGLLLLWFALLRLTWRAGSRRRGGCGRRRACGTLGERKVALADGVEVEPREFSGHVWCCGGGGQGAGRQRESRDSAVRAKGKLPRCGMRAPPKRTEF